MKFTQSVSVLPLGRSRLSSLPRLYFRCEAIPANVLIFTPINHHRRNAAHEGRDVEAMRRRRVKRKPLQRRARDVETAIERIPGVAEVVRLENASVVC